jgi:anti-sigma factor RsiW
MAGNPACEHFIPLLSPYVDGELPPSERVQVERHLTACRDCTGRTADLRAESALLRVGLDMAVDDVDFKDFAQRVMARVTPEKPPLLERLRLSLSELLIYHRTAMVSSLATAAVLVLVGVPVLLNQQTPHGYGAERMRVRAVSASEGAKVAPVVMEDQGDTIIWVVDEEPDSEEGASREGEEQEGEKKPAAPAPHQATPPSGGEL